MREEGEKIERRRARARERRERERERERVGCLGLQEVVMEEGSVHIAATSLNLRQQCIVGREE